MKIILNTINLAITVEDARKLKQELDALFDSDGGKRPDPIQWHLWKDSTMLGSNVSAHHLDEFWLGRNK